MAIFATDWKNGICLLTELGSFAAIPVSSDVLPSFSPCETVPLLVETRKHLLEGCRSLVLSTIVALILGGYLEELHEGVYLECGIDYTNPQHLKTRTASSRDTCMMVSVWEETDTVKEKWNILPKMASYGVRSQQQQICTEPSQISHFLNVFLGIFVMIGNTRDEAVHQLCGFITSQRFQWLSCFLYLLLTWAGSCASVNPHWFSWEWNVITAAVCVHQVQGRMGSLGFCVISGASNVPYNAFFYRRQHWLPELAASLALDAVPAEPCTTSSMSVLTQLRCGDEHSTSL